ncbi:MAG TPA: phosphodiester glycosidase family protein, partial [Chthoniobacterales bacterium]
MLAGLLSADFCARADWLVHSSARQKGSPNESVEHWKVELKNPDSTEQVTLHLAVFASRNATLKVIDQPEAPRRDLADVMTETKSLAGVNGGYFDPDDAPVGLLVCAGRVISPLRKAKLLSGVLAVTAKQVDIVRATNFQRRDRITFALQCGPLLVERATPVAGLNDTRQARRTFAAVDGNG